MDDVIFNKVASIERCISRVEEEYNVNPDEFRVNFTRQDAAILNLQRACEQSIDLANHLIRIKKLGAPITSRDSFDLLQKEGIISEKLSVNLKKMVGFRNIAVHEYSNLDITLPENIIRENLRDFKEFCKILLDRS
jgi:uncharacterized protein YutE (UPF0331/DUF86 family)